MSADGSRLAALLMGVGLLVGLPPERRACAQPSEPGVTPSVSPSATPTPEEPRLQVRGFAQTSYSVNLNNPADGRNLFHGYDEVANKIRLDVVDLDLAYAVDRPNRTGFRLDLTGGVSMPKVDAAAGLFRDPLTGVSNTDFDIRQMFLTHTFDNGLRLDAGKFATPFGYEIMDGVDGRNPNGTRSLSYTYSPFTHTGLKVTYPVSDQLSVTAMGVLGADNWQSTNSSFSFGGQINYHPSERFSVLVNYLDGAQRANNDTDHRRLIDLVTSWKVHDKVTLGLHALTGTEAGLGAQGGTASWNGLVLYLQTDISDDFSLNLRQEWFNDPEGARLGAPARVNGFTVTPEYRITPDWVVRLDFRFDTADRPVFNQNGRPAKHQNTIFLGQSYKFW